MLNLKEKVLSVNDYSSLSRREVAEFLSSLGDRTIYPTTIAKHAILFGYEKLDTIKLNRVQLFYILYCFKQLLDGGRLSHRQVIQQLDIDKDDENIDLSKHWNLIRQYGGLTPTEFHNRLNEFYVNCQIRRFDK